MSTSTEPPAKGCWLAYDRAQPERVVLMATDGTEAEFRAKLTSRYGAQWVDGDDEYPARLVVCSITQAEYDARSATGEWREEARPA